MDSPYQVGLTLAECLSVRWMWRTSLKLVNIITTSVGPWMKNIGWVMGESRNPVTPFGQQLAVGEATSFPARTSSLRLRITSLAQGWRMGLLRSARCWVGCRPVTRNSSFETYGCAGSCCIGPGPLAGGMNMRLYAYHPTFGSGAKLGGGPSAIAEKLKLPAR